MTVSSKACFGSCEYLPCPGLLFDGARSQSAGSPGPGEPTLAEVRAATERFRDVKIALADRYIRDPFDICETADMMGRPVSDGAMGVHYFRPDLLALPRRPRLASMATARTSISGSRQS